MLDDAIELLRCPHCGGALSLAGRVARCDSGHSFDVARQGYLNLLPGDADLGTADTAAMVEARAAFLSGGHYAPIADALAAACARAVPADAPGCVLDLGAGTGYYLGAALARLPERTGLALDISKHALRRAARADGPIAAIGCDAWQALPVRDGAAAVALSVFSPRNPAELARVLDPRGVLAIVTPTDRHLAEQVTALGLLTVDLRKRERLEQRLASRFELVGEEAVEYELRLSHGDLAELVAMGPNARHATAAEMAGRIAALTDPFPVTVSVTLSVHRPVVVGSPA